MGTDINTPVLSAVSTQIMNGPGGAETGQMGPTRPATTPYLPDYQSYAFVSAAPAEPQPSAMPQKNEKKRSTLLYIIIAILVVFICLCVALAIFLWFAPEAFWRDLFDFFNIPWPTPPMLFP
jgi:hypothetical protein